MPCGGKGGAGKGSRKSGCCLVRCRTGPSWVLSLESIIGNAEHRTDRRAGGGHAPRSQTRGKGRRERVGKGLMRRDVYACMRVCQYLYKIDDCETHSVVAGLGAVTMYETCAREGRGLNECASATLNVSQIFRVE